MLAHRKPVLIRWAKGRNFGDELNAEILPSYGVPVIHTTIEKAEVWGFGSILMVLPKTFTGDVLGAGLMSESEKKIAPNARWRLVRGRLTLERCSAPQNTPLGDPGLLVGRLIKPRTEQKWTLGIIPHYVDCNHPAVHILQQKYLKDIKIIDVLQPVDECLYEIANCEYIASSSLHGLIAADALGKPNVWLLLSDKVLGKGFKFRDYFSGLNEKVQRPPVTISGSETLSEIIHHTYKPSQALQETIARLDEVFLNFCLNRK